MPLSPRIADTRGREQALRALGRAGPSRAPRKNVRLLRRQLDKIVALVASNGTVFETDIISYAITEHVEYCGIKGVDESVRLESNRFLML